MMQISAKYDGYITFKYWEQPTVLNVGSFKLIIALTT